MSKTEAHDAPNLGFEVEISSGGRAYDPAAPTDYARPVSPTRLAAKAESRKRRAIIITACAALAAVLGLWAWRSNPNTNVPADAVTRVNGEYIYEKDITREVDLSRMANDLSKGKPDNVPSRATALENLISRKMQAQDAKKAGVAITPDEVGADIQDSLKRNGMTQGQLEKTLDKYNLTLDDMRAYSYDFLLINKYRAEYVTKSATTDQERINLVNDWLTTLSQTSKIDRLKSAGSGPAPSVGSEAPDFTLKDLNGKEIKLSSLKGRPVMLNFWATWCPPCRAEIPTLVQTYADTHKGDAPYEIIGVATQSDEATIQAFAREFNINFPITPDADNSVTDLYHVLPIPTSFFIDKDGIIRDMQVGPVERPQMEKWLLK